MYVVFFFFKTEPKIIEAINLRHDFKKKKSNLHETERILMYTIRGLYILYPLFEGQKRFSENSAFMYG